MSQDRVGSPLLPFTHEFLASMLGTGRASVSIAAGVLQKAGLIQYSSGAVRVLNWKKLEDATRHANAIAQLGNFRERTRGRPGCCSPVVTQSWIAEWGASRRRSSGYELLSSGIECHNHSDSSYRQRVLEKCDYEVRHVTVEVLTNVVSRDSSRDRP